MTCCEGNGLMSSDNTIAVVTVLRSLAVLWQKAKMTFHTLDLRFNRVEKLPAVFRHRFKVNQVTVIIFLSNRKASSAVWVVLYRCFIKKCSLEPYSCLGWSWKTKMLEIFPTKKNLKRMTRWMWESILLISYQSIYIDTYFQTQRFKIPTGWGLTENWKRTLSIERSQLCLFPHTNKNLF